jgi:hypothetical protein
MTKVESMSPVPPVTRTDKFKNIYLHVQQQTGACTYFVVRRLIDEPRSEDVDGGSAQGKLREDLGPVEHAA